MTVDIEKLKALALLATPSKWATDGEKTVMSAESDQLNAGYAILECHGPDALKNAKFAATASPAAVLELIAEIERMKSLFNQAQKCIDRINSNHQEAWKKRLGVPHPNYGGFPDKLDEAECERDQLKAECKALRNNLLEASEEIANWGAYASDYFQEKHDLSGCVAKFHDAATSKESEQ